MKNLFAASAFAVVCASSAAYAQSTTSPSTTSPSAVPGVMKMTQAECQSLWSTADASKAGSLTSAQAQTYVSDFKSVDTNNDGKLSTTEFMAGCEKGMVNKSASTGTSTGAPSNK